MTAQEAELRQATDGRFGLSDEQREAIRSITDARGIAAVVGFAGSGKSTLLKAAQARGPPPAGASWAQRWPARRPRDWRRAPGSEAARWPRGNTPGRGPRRSPAGDVFVIDEAGMIASGQLARVIDRIHAAGAKAVLVGDAMQLQPIQAGAAFRAISERVGFVELEGIRRQRGPAWQRQAALDFARGRTREGLQATPRTGLCAFTTRSSRPTRRS